MCRAPACVALSVPTCARWPALPAIWRPPSYPFTPSPPSRLSRPHHRHASHALTPTFTTPELRLYYMSYASTMPAGVLQESRSCRGTAWHRCGTCAARLRAAVASGHARGGRIVTSGATAGFHPAIDLGHIFIRQVEVLGSTMGSKAALLAVLAHVAAGRLERSSTRSCRWRRPPTRTARSRVALRSARSRSSRDAALSPRGIGRDDESSPAVARCRFPKWRWSSRCRRYRRRAAGHGTGPRRTENCSSGVAYR